MKKLFILSLFAFIVLALSAQKVNRPFTSDTVKGAETIYFTATNDIFYCNGLAGFFFKAANVSGTVNDVILQGSYDGTNFINIDTISNAANGSYFLYDKIKTSVSYSVSTIDTVTVFQSDTLTVLDTLFMTITDSCGTVHDTSTVVKYGSNSNISGSRGTSISSASATITFNEINPVSNFLRYRLSCTGGSGDTTIYNPVNFIYKEEF